MNDQPVIYASWDVMYERGRALTPDKYKVAEHELKSWKYFLRRKLLGQRAPCCEKCGRRNLRDRGGLQLHEGIIKKNEISMSVLRWWWIFSEYNCFLICAICHQEGLPRARFYKRAVEWYGKKAVDDWLETSPFKFTYREQDETEAC